MNEKSFLTDEFLQPVTYVTNHPIRIGFSGNLLRPDIDRKIFIQIINDNPDCIFECWGSYTLQQTNIGGGGDIDSIDFKPKRTAVSFDIY